MRRFAVLVTGPSNKKTFSEQIGRFVRTRPVIFRKTAEDGCRMMDSGKRGCFLFSSFKLNYSNYPMIDGLKKFVET